MATPLVKIAHVGKNAPMLNSKAVDVLASSTLESSFPTVEWSDKVQPLWTDESESTYSINVTIDDHKSGFSDVFPMLFDTGSGISWIYNSSCTEAACANAPKFNDPEPLYTSSSFSLTYLGDEISGSLVDTERNNLTFSFPYGLLLTNYSFGLSDSVPSFFSSLNLSGILGIQSSRSNGSPTNLLSLLLDASQIDKEVFALVLGGGSSSANQTIGGLLLLGSAAFNHTSLTTSEVLYCPVEENDSSYWLLEIEGVHFDGNYTSGLSTNVTFPKRAIIDTGTTGLALPLADANAFHAALFGSSLVTDGSGNYAFPCDAAGEAIFLIGGHNFSLSVSLITAEAYTSPVLTGYCASKVQGLETTYWILGASFLQNFYSVFDLENQRVGFALRVKSYTLTTLQTSASTSVYSTSAVSNSLSIASATSLSVPALSTLAHGIGAAATPAAGLTLVALLHMIF